MHERMLRLSVRLRNWPAVVIVVGIVAFLIASAVSWLAPFVPRVHDEFSYLLAADTFIHGRLANPTPDVWEPFQSFHILMEPSYASKYPVGLSAFIALGWIFFGVPIAGCWLAAGICASSMTWMLAAVTSRRWAVLGGLLVASHPIMQVSWSQTLMSGWLTAAGSALLMGGVFRLRRGHHVFAALACGIGVGLLSLTRPFEGLVATVLSTVMLLGLWQGWTFRQKLSLVARALPVAAMPISAALFAIAIQNYAITGRLDRLSYQVHEQQYGVAPLFVFGQQHIPEMESTGQLSTTMRSYHYGWSLDSFTSRVGLRGWLIGIVETLWTAWGFWNVLLFIPLMTVGLWWRYRVARWLVVTIVMQILFSATVCWVFPHYLSPVLPALLALTVIGLRRFFCVLVRAHVLAAENAPHFMGAIIAVQVLLLIVNAVLQNSDPAQDWAKRRAAVVADLSSRDGRHLVLVDYAPDHNVHHEWVYNLSDLEQGKVLWARGERKDWNERLAAKYQQSHFIWRLEADRQGAALELSSSPR